MYIVNITTGNLTITIHGDQQKLKSGKVNKGINTIDSFTFSILPDNPGFNLINEFSTLVTVYNTNKYRYEFIGRVLYAETTMDEGGLITKSVTCENILGYLCDSWQIYTETQNWTVSGMLQHLIDCHNSQVEEYKHFKLGTITAKDSNDNLYQAVQRENTWDAIKSKLLDKIGGELQVRVEEDGMYLDYLEQIGEEKRTEIAMSVNMKAITREQDPTAFVTRLIPLGAKLSEDSDSEQRLDISEVNNGSIYIDDAQAIEVYGVHVGVVEWDDVTEAGNLLSKGETWLKENNKVQVKYSITALDLSLIGLAYDDFCVGNTHPIKNALIGIDDLARITTQAIDVCEPTRSTIEVGDNFKTLSDIQREQAEQLKAATNGVKKLEETVAPDFEKINQRITELEEDFSSEITQLADSIKLKVSGSLGSKASIILSAGTNEYTGEMDLTQIRKAFADDKTAISISTGTLTFNSNTIIINSSNFTLDSAGKITANDAVIKGEVTTISGVYKAELSSGGLELYYSNALCGTLSTKYYSTASCKGISLRVEEGGNYIMFSHPNSSYATGYEVDYYLNYGWSDNYDEMHVFQTTARFLDKVYFSTHVYSAFSITVTSDRNKKNSIEDLPDVYETLFDELNPVRFRYNDGGEKYHVGYIAQDVENAVKTVGLEAAEFAGLDQDGYGNYCLAYDEFIALLHLKIKRLEQRIADLEK